MRLKAFIPSLLIALVCIAPLAARAQDQTDDADVRGAFLTSRPSAAASSSSRAGDAGRKSGGRRRTRQGAGRATGAGPSKETSAGTGGAKDAGAAAGPAGSTAKSLASSGSGASDAAAAKGQSPAGSKNSAASAAPLALGYTLYMRDASGDAVRVDPAREFHNGDRVRISLETNTDSYLYVFHTENDGQPEMIFPDARLDAGDNFIEAHVPAEIPSSQEQDERLRWFAFYGQPATERLYIILTREPLPLVPTGQALVDYCQANKARCPWHPLAEVWAQVQRETSARVLVDKTRTYGQAQTAGEREATTRGFGLDQSAPAPSVIRMSATSATGILVTPLELVHK